MLDKIAGLASFCADHPEASLSDLAYTLATQELLSDQRLALVASSLSNLEEKLIRAKERLKNPDCLQIREVQGIYFFENPLGRDGQLAEIFPGEGAPYLGMIGDLPNHFPEVADVVSHCDEMTGTQSQTRLSKFLSLPEDVARRSQLEQELQSLGNTMFSVLMVDWALHDLFRSLGITPDAVAGHSAGELAALWVSRSLIGELELEELRQTMDFLDADEQSPGSESVLFAVGASRESMQQLLAEVSMEFGYPADASPLFLAMDNCPHQTVVIGPPNAMMKIADVLRERKIMHERLPFNRPYHTPLFEPQMGPLARLFDRMPFQAPEIPLYSCSTGKPFPRDPLAIRELAMTHWIRPVEFTRMIRNMHDDGVRIFLELGPRGNLTSFVSDILRGREFLAVAADVQRHSGLTQLHHVLGQLFAQHVPMQREAFYRHRNLQTIAWNSSSSVSPTPSTPVQHSERATIVNAYWNVMGDFLDLQQQVMEQYLHRQRNGASRPAAQPNGHSPLPQPDVSIRPQPSPELSSVPQPNSVTEVSAHQLPLVGQVERLIPGQEVVVRRCLDLTEDHYGDHHTVGGREVSYVYPERNGQPVVPMTFSLELMAEAARLLSPGLVVTAIRNVQLVQWLAFDEDLPPTIELTARIVQSDETSAELEVRISDLGFLGEEPKTGVKGDLTAVATVEMRDRYPTPPPVEDFPLTGERPCYISLDVLYKNLFHGELFQGVVSLDRFGEEGIQGQVRVLPRENIFRSNPDPQFVLDPVLMDVGMHPLAGWHLEQPDQSGRILLPYELGEIRFFGPRPEVDTEMTSRGRIEHESSRRFTHSVEFVGPNNRMWCTMERLKYWRFYLPFGEFNFHGPKHDYFLSDNWSEAIADFEEKESACCVGLLPPRDLEAPGMMLASARVTLTAEELQTFRRLDLPDAKKSEWLFGRMAAKDAVRILWRQRIGERTVPADIAIDPDELGKPIASPVGQDRPADYPHVSIAHTEGIVAALGSFDLAPGIDLERIVPREDSFEKAAFNAAERNLVSAAPTDRDETVTRFWCAKEAVSKALGQGMVEGPQSLSVTEYDPATGHVMVEIGQKLADRLPDGASDFPIVAHTHRKEDFIVATVLLESERTCPAVTMMSSGKSPGS